MYIMQYIRDHDWYDILAEEILLKWLKEKDRDKTFGEWSQRPLEEMISIVKETVYHIKYNIEAQDPLKWSEMLYIWNIAWFVLLISADLKSYIKILCKSTEVYDRIVTMKSIAVLLYEAWSTINHLIAKDYYQACEKLCVWEDLIKKLRVCQKWVSLYWNKYNESLGYIRNNIWAHRDDDFLTQIKCWEDIKLVNFLPVVLEYDNLLNDLWWSLQKIMNFTINNFSKELCKEDV